MIGLTGCNKDDESSQQLFFVNVYIQDSPSLNKALASPSSVFLFEDTGKEVDNTASASSVRNNQVMTFTDGTTSDRCKYSSPSTTGVNTFEDINNGKYIIWVVYVPYGFLAHSSSQKIVVDKNIQAKNIDKIFLNKGTFGYQAWNEGW